MRVIVIVLTVVVIVVVLYFTGVGRGLNACLEDCKQSKCMMVDADVKDCQEEPFKVCTQKCYQEHGDEK